MQYDDDFAIMFLVFTEFCLLRSSVFIYKHTRAHFVQYFPLQNKNLTQVLLP